jgi:hypothetical protein
MVTSGTTGTHAEQFGPIIGITNLSSKDFKRQIQIFFVCNKVIFNSFSHRSDSGLSRENDDFQKTIELLFSPRISIKFPFGAELQYFKKMNPQALFHVNSF